MVEEASRDQGAHPAVHREGRAALLGRRGRSRPSRCSRSRCCSGQDLQADAAAGDDLHDRRLPVCGGAGHDAAAAVGHRQRRPARPAGEIRRRDGAARPRRPRRLRQDRHPHRGHAPRRRGRASCRRPRPGRRACPGRWPPPPRTPSEHPLGRAVVAAATERGLAVAARRGLPVHARSRRHVRWSGGGRRVGSPALWAPARTRGRAPTGGPAADAADRARGRRPYRGRGHPRRRPGRACWAWPTGCVPAAAEMVAALAPSTGAAPILLTGDNERAAAPAGRQVGITDVRAGLLPEDKVDAVRDLQERRAPGDAGR